MDRQPLLHEILKGLDGVEEAYYQPINGAQMVEEPHIVYKRDGSYVAKADNILWWLKKRYTVTVVSRSPSSLIPDQVEALPYSRFDRRFEVNGRYHTMFQLYF